MQKEPSPQISSIDELQSYFQEQNRQIRIAKSNLQRALYDYTSLICPSGTIVSDKVTGKKYYVEYRLETTEDGIAYAAGVCLSSFQNGISVSCSPFTRSGIPDRMAAKLRYLRDCNYPTRPAADQRHTTWTFHPQPRQ